MTRLPGGRCSLLTFSGRRGHVDRRGDILGCHTSPVPGDFVRAQQRLVAELNDDDACLSPGFLAFFPRQVPALLLFIYL